MGGTRAVGDKQAVSAKGRRIEFERYEALVAVVGVVVFFANLGPYLSTVLPVVQPKWELLAFGLLAAPIVLHRVRSTALLKDKLLWFVGGVAALFLIGAVIHSTSPSLLLLQMTALLTLVTGTTAGLDSLTVSLTTAGKIGQFNANVPSGSFMATTFWSPVLPATPSIYWMSAGVAGQLFYIDVNGYRFAR